MKPGVWSMPVIPVLQKPGHKLQCSLGYTARLSQTNKCGNTSVFCPNKIMRQMFTYGVALSVRPDPARRFLAWPRSFVRKWCRILDVHTTLLICVCLGAEEVMDLRALTDQFNSQHPHWVP